MKRIAILILSGICGALVAIPASAAEKSSPPMNTGTNSAVRSAWPPETISGKVTMVDPQQRLVVIQDSDGVPFDMVVTGKTHIESGNEAVPLQDLSQYQNRNVSIRFVPERRGDVAESIRIGG